MAIESMEDLMLEELREIYSAERLAVQAYPRLRKALQTKSLGDAVERHLAQTKEQISRLEQVFELMEVRPRAKTCHAMQGLVDEAREHLEADLTPELLEVMLVADLQKIEHFEIAAYGSARAHAEALGMEEAAELLEQTLEEEKETDALLNQVAEEEVNPSAVSDAEEEEGEEAAQESTQSSRGSGRSGRSSSGKSRSSRSTRRPA
jgi:ferritin-like metal-binding protein YciE